MMAHLYQVKTLATPHNDQNACDADNDVQHYACGKLHEQRMARKRQGNPKRKDLQ